ncbi:DUF427 domain-containing protein [Azospirillum tabaci]|uniref:DUF427 domain-containing protein n=1 Tax=Azospirillum tabaci TaxID=2752310 RepID=UPI0031B5FA5D
MRVVFASQVVADTARALTLTEAKLPVVQYIPRADVDMTALERTAHTTHCPYKGDATYYNLRVGDRIAINAVWIYETPYPAVAAIREHLAFYPERVDCIEEHAAT